MSYSHQKKRAIAEVFALFLSSALYVFSENVLGYRAVPILILLVAWGVYLLKRIQDQPDFLKQCGLRFDNTFKSVKLNTMVLLLGLCSLAAGRYWMGWEMLPADSLIIFGIYPFWAFVQQFALQGLLVRNLKNLDVPVGLIVVSGALAYALAHLPDFPLACVTAGAGVIWVSTFLISPNLLPLSITHAVLGTCTYYWILERNPVEELFETTVF